MVPVIEALADAIASLNDWSNPESEAYQLRNPGLLRSFTLRHESDDYGRRIFPRFVDGYQALLFDLQTKCSGKSRSKLKKDSVISDLLTKGFAQPSSSEEYVLCFLHNALPKLNITSRTPLGFFVQETK